jgi:beta-glucosidase
MAALGCAVGLAGCEVDPGSGWPPGTDDAAAGAHDVATDDAAGEAEPRWLAVPAPDTSEAERLAAYCPRDWREVEQRVTEALAALTLEEKTAQMAGVRAFPTNGVYPTPAVPRLGIPGLRMMDGPRGVTKGAGNATAFPVGACRGATFDPELEREVGAAIAREVLAKSGNVLLAPTVNLLRHPRWGRAQETYGEDPVHLAEMGRAFVEGAQAQGVLASVKHFALNSIEDTRFDVNVLAAPRPLREMYLPHFRKIVQDGRAASVMSAYNLVNGAYCSENPPLLRDILKGEWGFMGFVESDWLLGTRSTVAAAEAGLDIEMPIAGFFGPKLATAVQQSELDEAVVDEAVRRILRAQFCFGLDERTPTIDPRGVETAEHRALARRVAARGAVLLRNEGKTLPLEVGPNERVVVTGPLANVDNIGDNGSSAVSPSEVTNVLEGLRAALGDDRVVFVDALVAEPTALAEAAQGAAAVVVVVGLTSAEEGESLIAAGDRKNLRLPDAHNDWVATAAEIHPRTVVVLQGSGAVEMPWLAQVGAVLMAWYPGMEGGHAIASLLLGAESPSGRLTHVFPVSEADLPAFDNVSLEVTYDAWHGYRHLDRSGVSPLFPYGFGLTYTEFRYDALELEDAAPTVGDEVVAVVKLTNVGQRAGREVVQLYASAPDSSIERPVRQLAAFASIELDAGESGQVALRVPVSDLAVWSEERQRFEVEAVEYSLEAAPFAGATGLTATFVPREAEP